ncbi:MAG: hypothetical protein K940chlam2_01712 [Chlamydiae bacterium]|nr:hypothetical protein [Chlamydiota bacterium]
MSSSVGIGSSVVGTADEKFFGYLDNEADDSIATRIGKNTVAVLSSPLFSLAFLVETVVRLVVAAVAKLAHLFMPEDSAFTRTFEKNLLFPLARSILPNAAMIPGAVIGTVMGVFCGKNSLCCPDSCCFEQT